MLDEDTSRLIGRIYAGAHDRTIWDEAVSEVCQRLSARWAMVAIFDERERAPVRPDIHQVPHSRFMDGIADYEAEVHRIDPTNHFAARNPAGGVFDSRAAVADPAEYFDHPFVRWNSQVLGDSFWRLCYSGREGLRMGVSIHCHDANGPLGAHEAKLFDLLYTHMDQATRLAARPPSLTGPEALMLLDRQGRVLTASDAAAAMLAQGDALRIDDGRPIAADRTARQALDMAIGSALSIFSEGGGGGAALLARPVGPPLLATVTPLPLPDVPFPNLRAAAMVRLTDPAASDAPRSDWRALFGFTTAETRLAEALLAGDGSLREVADTLGIAYSTARVQLASVFDKVDVRSQVQLVKLLTRLG